MLKAVATVLHLQPESLYARLGLLEERSGGVHDVEEALRHDPRLTAAKKDVMLRLYRVLATDAGDSAPNEPALDGPRSRVTG